MAREITYSSTIYSSLQHAIDDLQSSANTTNILNIPRGTYQETVTISDNITLKGNETAGVIWNADNIIQQLVSVSGNVFVELRNITFTNAPRALDFKIGAQGNINNCVFSMGNTNTAILMDSTSSANIFNNTFHDNGVAVNATNVMGIQNNIFSTSGNSLLSLTSEGNVSNNLFVSEPANNILGSANLAGSAEFVSEALLDFHLKTSSPAKDTGLNIVGLDVLDGSTVDLGAYGGARSDTIPNVVIGFTATSSGNLASSLDISLSWRANADYQVKGYFLYYDVDQAGEPYSGNVTGTTISPVDLGLVTSATLSGLNISEQLTTSPNITSTIPRNQKLTVNWTAVSRATGYRLQYQEVGSSQGFTSLDVGDVSSAEITGLDNQKTYEIKVLGLIQPAIYFALGAYYSNDQSLARRSSLSSSTAFYQVPLATEGPASSLVTASPEETVPYPVLPNNGGGCLLRGGK